MRLIDADGLTNMIKPMCGVFTEDAFMIDYHSVLSIIENAPSIDMDRPQGEWKDVPPNAWEFNGIIQWRECSVCKCRSMFISNYCPHCGARMKK